MGARVDFEAGLVSRPALQNANERVLERKCWNEARAVVFVCFVADASSLLLLSSDLSPTKEIDRAKDSFQPMLEIIINDKYIFS